MLDFFTGVFCSTYYTGLFLNLCVVMCVSALGNVMSLKCGIFNLGGEGQIYLGGFAGALCLVKFSFLPPALNFIFSLLISCSLSGVLCMLSAFCNDVKKISVLLSTYLFSAAVIPVIDYLISVPCRTKSGNLLATEFIGESVRLKSILPPSPFNLSFFALFVIIFAVWFLLNKTKYGKEMCIWGKSNEFALYSALSYRKIIYPVMFADGFLHGFSGFLLVAGMHFTCHISFANGLGWNALTCSLLAGKNPLYIIPSGLFLSWLFTSASRFSLVNNFGFDISGVIQGVIIFVVAGNIALTKIRIKGLRGKK